MANLTETANFDTVVFQLETTTAALGGAGGVMNAQAQALANRTQFLLASVNGRLSLAGGTMTGALTLNADPTAVLHAATKQYVDAAVGAKVSAASPSLTGTPTAPTATVDTSTTQLATTAFMTGQAASIAPGANGTAAVGTSLRYARQDHVHPTDTSRAPLNSPTFTGNVTIPTGASIAGYVQAGANSSLTSLSGLTTPLTVGQGGTGANSAASARSNLGAAPIDAPSFTGAVSSSGQITIRNGSPTLYLQDWDNRGGAIHCNSDRVYIISCPVDSQTFSVPANGRWPFEANTSNGDVVIGRNLDVLGGQLTASTAVIHSGLAWEGSNQVKTYWDGRIRFTHEIGAPSINCQDVYSSYISHSNGGAPFLRTLQDGNTIRFHFCDDWNNYVRFFRGDGYSNYLMMAPNMRYMDAREWGGVWAMLVQQSDGGNQVFYPAAYSDERFKTNVAPTQVDALAAIAAVEVVEYDWNDDGLAVGNIRDDLKHVKVGVIGQQAVEHVPEMFEAGPVTLPSGDTEYRMSVHPDRAVPYLIRAIQQQQEMIASLTARVAALEAAARPA